MHFTVMSIIIHSFIHSSYFFLCDGDGGGVKSNSIHTHYDGREFTVHLDKFS